MTQAFADSPRRVADLPTTPPWGAWFDGDHSLPHRLPAGAALVRPLWMAIAGLAVAAVGALAVAPAPSSSEAAVAAQPTAVDTPAAVVPLEITCGATHVGNQARFTANFTVSGGANVARWQVDYGDGELASGTALAKLPAHTYTQPGKYIALLTATTADGTAVSSTCVTDWIVAVP